MLGESTFYNESPSPINVKGTVRDGSYMKRTGNGWGSLIISENTTIEGNCEIYSESSNSINFENAVIPNNFIFENKTKRGSMRFYSDCILHPNVKFTVERAEDLDTRVSTWSRFEVVKDAKLTFSGTGRAIMEPCYTFGGHLNLQSDGYYGLVLQVGKDDWNGETIRYNIYNFEKSLFTKYLWVRTLKWGPYLDVDSVKTIYLEPSSSFADKTKIHVTGNDEYGAVSLCGAYSGTVEIEYNASPNSEMYLYNNLSTGNKIVFNAPNSGSLKCFNTAVIEGVLTVNNKSSKRVNIQENVNIGNGVIINVREDYPSNLYISTDIPAGATVNY